jgi:hypothetical protein
MRKINEVLRLRFELKRSHRQIARSIGAASSTVAEYLRRFGEAGLTWPLSASLSEAELEAKLFPPAPSEPVTERAEPDWAALHAQMRRPGVTLMLLWQEYRASHPQGFAYSWFCEHYRSWVGRLDLAHGALQALAKAPVVQAELAVAVGAPRVSGAVLLPQQRKRHALAFELLVNAGKVGRGVACRRSARRPEQPRLQRRVVKRRDQRPANARLKGAFQVAGDRSLGQAGGGGNTLMAELGLEFEAQDFFDLAHGFPLGGHPRLRKQTARIARRS